MAAPLLSSCDSRPIRDTYESMQAWGKIRSRTRNGRKSYYLDFRPEGRVWATPNGHPLESERHAETVLNDIRRAVWDDGKTRAQALAPYIARTSPRLRLGNAYRAWVARMREAEARGDVTRSYVDELARYGREGGYLATLEATHYATIRYAHLEDLDASLAARGLSPKTRQHVLAALKTFYRWMHRRGDVAEVPTFPTVSVPEREPTILSPDQQRAVLDQIPEARRGIFLALAHHGLRPSEALRLDAADYDWDRGVMRLVAAKAKTRQAASVPCSPELRGWLEAHTDRRDRLEGLALFRNPLSRQPGGRWTLDAMEDSWNRACRAIGVRCGLYTGTKHSSATAALRRGVPLDQIQAALRHADIRSTGRYAKAAELAPVGVLGRDDG